MNDYFALLPEKNNIHLQLNKDNRFTKIRMMRISRRSGGYEDKESVKLSPFVE
jgi:hypothetical protein